MGGIKMSVGDKPKKTTDAQQKALKETSEEKLNKVKERDKKTKVVNTGRSSNGTLLKGDLAALNEKFRGDQFKAEDSFNNSVSEPKRSKMAEANSRVTCPLNGNLDGHSGNNDEFIEKLSADEKQSVAELSEMRQGIDKVNEDTVMQKVIGEDAYGDYIEQEKKIVTGCASKASDAAPFTCNAEEAYENLRLDYKGTEFQKKADNGESIYVMRCTSKYCLDNSEYPYVNETEWWNNPPCTGTGTLGGDDYLIPEYSYGKGQNIKDGAIYTVDKDGNESMAAAWDRKKGIFKEIN